MVRPYPANTSSQSLFPGIFDTQLDTGYQYQRHSVVDCLFQPKLLSVDIQSVLASIFKEEFGADELLKKDLM